MDSPLEDFRVFLNCWRQQIVPGNEENLFNYRLHIYGQNKIPGQAREAEKYTLSWKRN